MSVLQRVILVGGMVAIAMNAMYAPRIYSSDSDEPVARAWIFDTHFNRADSEIIEWDRAPQRSAAQSSMLDGSRVWITWNPVELDLGFLIATTIAGSALTIALYTVAGVGLKPAVSP